MVSGRGGINFLETFVFLSFPGRGCCFIISLNRPNLDRSNHQNLRQTIVLRRPKRVTYPISYPISGIALKLQTIIFIDIS